MKQVKNSRKVVPLVKNAEYYFQKGNYYCRQNKLEKALLFYKKTIEVEPHNSINHYNLACLLSRMGHLEKANQVFSYIVHKIDPSMTECYFLMAVNYGLLDDLDKTRYYLNLYLQLSPDGEMVDDAEELFFALSSEEDFISIEEDHSNNEEKNGENEEIARHYREDKEVRNILFNALYHKNEQYVEKAIRFYGSLMEGIGERVLKEFVRNPWVKQRLRLQALLELKNMGIKGLVPVFMEGTLREVDIAYYPLVAPRWQGKWQQVMDRTLQNMRLSKSYNERFYEDAQSIWIDFLNNLYPRVPKIKKIEVWAAGLEYALAKYHFLGITQKMLSEQYNISPSSISVRYKEINEVLHIEHRAYQNMLMYLTRQDRDQEKEE